MPETQGNPVSYLLGVHRGRNTPIRNDLDPETEAKLRKQYVGMLVELEKADTSMKNAQVSTFGNIANATASAWANFAAAIAEAQKAGAMTDEAVARGLEGLNPMLKMAAEFRAYEPPAEQVKKLEEFSRQAANQGSADASMAPDVIRQRLAAIPGGNTDGQYQALATLMDQSFGQFFSNNTSILNQVPVGTPQRVGLADASDRKLREVSSQVLTQKLQAAGMDTAMVPQFVDRYVAERSYLNKLTPAEVDAANLKALQGSKDINEFKDFWMSKSAGMDPEVRKKTIASLDVLGGILGGGVQGFGKVLAETPSTPGVIQARDIIQRGMLSLNGKPDPLNKAVDDMWSTVPGFAMWAEAKGFGEKREGREKAALYASKHPDELLGWVRATREDKSLLTDPQSAMLFVNPKNIDATLTPDEQALAASYGEAPRARWAPSRRTGQVQQDASAAALDGEMGEGLPDEGAAQPRRYEADGETALPKPSERGRQITEEPATLDETGAVTKGGKTYPVGSPEWFATHPEAVAGARQERAEMQPAPPAKRTAAEVAEVADLVNTFDQGEAPKQAAVGTPGVRTEPLPPGMAGPVESWEDRKRRMRPPPINLSAAPDPGF